MPSSIIEEPRARSTKTLRPPQKTAGSSRAPSTEKARRGMPAATVPRKGIVTAGASSSSTAAHPVFAAARIFPSFPARPRRRINGESQPGGGPSARPAAPASPTIAAPPGSEALRPRLICAASAPVFRELDQPLHPAVPYTAPLLGDDPGRGAADRELLAHPLEVDALVAPGAVEGLLAAEPLLADRVELAGELDHLDTLEAREQRLTVDVAPEPHALREGPA